MNTFPKFPRLFSQEQKGEKQTYTPEGVQLSKLTATSSRDTKTLHNEI